MNDFDSELDARIRTALHAAANQITPESLSPSRPPASTRATQRSRAPWVAPLLAAAAVAAITVGTVAVVTSSPSASRHVQPGGTSPLPSGTNTQPGTPHDTTATATPVSTANPPQIVCAFSDVPSCHSASYYVPIWPFANYAQAEAWAKNGNGSQPWHADPSATALLFTQQYLGFSDITKVTSAEAASVGSSASVGVGYDDPNGKPHTAAVLHLVQYGSTDGGWEVVGTDDTDFSLIKPAYGSQITQIMDVSGRITGVDENVVVTVRMQDGTIVSQGNPSTPAGGSNSPWQVSVTTSVPGNGRQSFPVVVIAFTGGHVQQHERFTIQGVYV